MHSVNWPCWGPVLGEGFARLAGTVRTGGFTDRIAAGLQNLINAGEIPAELATEALVPMVADLLDAGVTGRIEGNGIVLDAESVRALDGSSRAGKDRQQDDHSSEQSLNASQHRVSILPGKATA